MTRREIIEAAERIVCTDRNLQYGAPEDSFNCIADFWTTYMAYRNPPAPHFEAEDVAVMMLLLKVARITTGRNHLDNFIDICGYAACGGEIASTEDSK